MRFSWPIYWGGLPLPLPADHVLSELSAMTCLSWVALHSMAHSFIELCKPLYHDKAMFHEGRKNTRKNCIKKILMNQITMMVWLVTQGQTFWGVKSSAP